MLVIGAGKVGKSRIFLIFLLHPILLAADEHVLVSEQEEEYELSWFSTLQNSNSKGFDLYRKACGECHIAFPANMMVRANWQRIMNHLDKHFGDNAELDTGDRQEIANYLQENGASNKYWTKKSHSLRLTDTLFFRHEHGKLEGRLVGQNAKIKTFSRCKSCHTGADRGRFSETDTRMKGYKAWED